jgi:hypothetical protein
VGAAEPLVDHRSLLVEDHPRHDRRADVRRQEQYVGAVVQGDADEPVGDPEQAWVREDHGWDEDQLGEPERDTDAFRAPVAPGEGDPDEEGGGNRHHEGLGDTEEVLDACDPGELGQQRANPRGEEGQRREQPPPTAEACTDERARMSVHG